MRNVIERILNEYIAAKNEPFSGHMLGSFVRTEAPIDFYETGLVDRQKYLISGSVGQGNWASVPWIGIFDRSITTSATRGVYIVYLLAKDGNTFYLTFNQGCTAIRNTHSVSETISIMRKNAEQISSKIDGRGFATDEGISLGEHLTELAEMYQKGTIFYKGYKKNAVPSETELRDDLQKMMQIYRDYVEYQRSGSVTANKGGDKTLKTRNTINRIKEYISQKGFSYEDGLIENFYLSLKSKPFVILAGTSGTGKTRLAKLFAEATGANAANGRYKMVSVRPDWSDSSDLFGHVNLNGKFIPGAILDFVKTAESDLSHPYFLCLDEMNLARVEYYLSDVLSVIETRTFADDERIVTDDLISDKYYGEDVEAALKYGAVSIPENLFIVGTVNMDETTFPFSKKVLDRANTIEFSYVDLIPTGNESFSDKELPQTLDNSFLKGKYLLLAQCMEEKDQVNEFCSELQQLNQILLGANAHIGYRVRDEIVFYLLNNEKDKLLQQNDAFDNEIMQKVLPRIQGSSAAVKTMLCDLFKYCAGDYEGYQTEDDDISSKMIKAAKSSDCKYKKSAAKIAFMVRRYEEDGFTSYWL